MFHVLKPQNKIETFIFKGQIINSKSIVITDLNILKDALNLISNSNTDNDEFEYCLGKNVPVLKLDKLSQRLSESVPVDKVGI
jgi:hypothetical protein